jgi:hypothetical protein
MKVRNGDSITEWIHTPRGVHVEPLILLPHPLTPLRWTQRTIEAMDDIGLIIRASLNAK